MKLSEYRKKVNSGKIDEIAEEFKESCPICGGGNCAKYNGYYTRQVVDEGYISLKADQKPSAPSPTANLGLFRLLFLRSLNTSNQDAVLSL